MTSTRTGTSAEKSENDRYGSFSVDQVPPDVAPLTVEVDEAIERLGMGRFQTDILFAAGLCFAADAMEILLLSFLSVVLKGEWDLAEQQVNTLFSVVFAGAMVGTLVLSPLGDVIGRRPVFTITAATISIFGIGTAFCQTYNWLLFTRFMVGFGVGGLTVPFDTLAEFVPNSNRGTNLLEIEFFWTAGTLLVPVVAWYTLGDSSSPGSWPLFVFICAVPCVFSTALGLLLVPESPMWLVTQSRQEEALRIVRKAAARNGLDPLSVFPEGTELIDGDHKVEERSSIWDLFSPKWLKITLLLWGVWFGLSFLYYGVIIAVTIVFSVHLEDDDDQEGNYDFDYGAIFISASAEIFGLIVVLFTIDRYGRISTQSVAYLIGGGSCLLFLLAASTNASRIILLILAFLTRMAMMGLITAKLAWQLPETAGKSMGASHETSEKVSTPQDGRTPYQQM
eukprot:scaffold1319_cov126-Cylindrotheca_fusiformis.AAC.43